MKITCACLVLIVALGATQAQKPSKPFPDILAPFRNIFGRGGPPSGPTGQPHRAASQQQGQKDLNGAATSKPYGGQSSSPSGDDEDGFRPSLFGSGGYSPGPGPSHGPHDSPHPHPHPRPHHGRGPPHGGPPHGGPPHHGRPGPHNSGRPGTNRPVRQETESAYGNGAGFGPFALESDGGRGSGGSPFGGDFGGFGGGFHSQAFDSQDRPGGSGGHRSPGGPHSHGGAHGPPQHGPPHGHSHGGHGPQGPPPSHHGHGGPRPSHSPSGPSRYRGGPHGGPPSGPPQGPHSAPSHSPRGPPPHGGPLGHGGPAGGHGGNHGAGGHGPRPFSRPSPNDFGPGTHYNGASASPTIQPSYFGPGGDEYPEQFEGGNRETREPQIITADDVQKPHGGFGGPQFDEVYQSPGGASSFGPPSTNPGFGIGYSAPSGHPYGRQIPDGFGGPGSADNPIEVGLIRSNPIRPSTRPYANTFITSDEESPYLRQASGKRPFHSFSRPVQGSYQASSEDVHYGRPMMMSASKQSPQVMMRAARNPRAGGRRKKQSNGIVQLHSPKDPNYIMPSASTIDAVTAASDLSASATGGGDFYQGDDRILYHVAGHQGPYSYRFGYDTGKGSHNRMFRHEEKDGKGYVKGRYGYYDKHGKLNLINYQAHPQHGFQAERGHAKGQY